MKNRLYIMMLGMLLMTGASTTASAQIIKGKVFGGGQLAQVNGGTGETACNVTINSGEVYSEVYGAGEGVKIDENGVREVDRPNVAKVTGNVKVSLLPGSSGGGTAWRDVFGGGALAKVDGNTYVSMSGGHIAANLFGGGEGDIKMNAAGTAYEYVGDKLVVTSADITGNTNVEITGGDIVWDRTSMTTATSSSKTTYTYTKVVTENGETSTLVVTSDTKQQDLIEKGYTETVTTEETSTVEGEIVYWDPSKPSTPDTPIEEIGGKKYANKLFYNDATKRFVIEHNIFGGGYIACNVNGTANVTMTKGLGDNKLTATSQWKYAFDDFAHPHFYAFGGGYGAYTTVKNTIVDVNVESYNEELDADTDEQLARPRKAMGSGTPRNENPIAVGIYNNQYGIAEATVLGVLGGSYAGFVKENTQVTIGGKTFINRVYGGGFGQLEAYKDLRETDVIYSTGTGGDEVQRTRKYLGEVAGNTVVNIEGGNIYGNVFGGGAGVESVDMSGNGTIDTDFAMGRVMGKTEVNIYGNASVFGNVYGGGDIANVLGEGSGIDRARTVTETLDDDFATNLNIYGGKVYGKVFGGGSGRPANQVAHYNRATDNFNSVEVGMIGKSASANEQGHTRVHIYDLKATQEDVDEGLAANVGDIISSPYVYGDIYGGCAYGVVTGTSEVLIDGGKIGDNIFGGGLGDIEETVNNDGTITYGKVTSANVLGNSIVTINGGYALWNEMSDDKGNMKFWPRENYTSRNTEITSANEFFYNAKTKRFTLDHNVYGGGNVACVVGRYSDKANKTSDGTQFNGSDKPVKRFPVLFKEGEFKSGNTVVMMNESHFSDPELFMNYANWVDDPDWSLAAKCWQATMEEQREPQFSVFGAGKGLLTKTLHNAQARVEVLAVKYDVDSRLIMIDGKPEEHWTVGWDEAYEYMLQWNEEDNDGGTDKARLANFFPEKSWVRPNYVDAERRLRTAAFAKQIGVAGNTVMQIVGGGYDGCVAGNTLASGESRAIIGKMYGGGYGSYDGWKLAMDLDAANGNKHNYKLKVGTVGGQAVLNIDRGCLVRGDVFAGGAGVESLKLDNDNNIIPETSPNYESAEYHDFDQVALANSTHLKFGLIGASKGYEFVVPVVYGSVYGGGDVANVTGVAKSEVVRGQTMQYFFGGGNGRLTSLCNDYTKLGGVGATDVHFDKVRKNNNEPEVFKKDYGPTITNVEYFLEPIIWDRVYAGGRNGLVRGYDSDADGNFNGANDVKPDTKMVIDGGQFGYNIFGGGEGTIDTLVVDGKETYEITSADILGNTNIIVNGGEQNIDQIWDPVTYEWVPLDYDEQGTPYTPQYDWRITKFNISHNIYAGGRTACVIGSKDGSGNLISNTGDTHVTMTKGMLDRQYFESFGTPILESWEWRDIYAKHASPHFCVFGGGYGENALVLGDTHIDVKLDKGDNDAVKPSDDQQTRHHHDQAGMDVCYAGGGDFMVTHEHQKMVYTKFPDGQSLMDIIGGGYSGDVMGTCNISVDGNTYARNIFGGGYYANVGATVVDVNQGNIDNIYGGGMMGDVKNTVTINVGQASTVETAETIAAANKEVVILGNVYGANDVAGLVGATETENGEIVPTKLKDSDGNDTEETVDGTTINLRGGHIHGNVYGGGNGDYLYMVDQNVTIVTAEEQYKIGDDVKLVYRVPIRKQDFPSLSSMSDAQKIVNISTYRPAIMKTKIDFKGNSAEDLLRVDGNIFGGGSSATVSNFTGNTADSYVKLNVGSHIRVGGVFLGSDGDALFNTSGTNNFIEDFPKLNNITLAKTVDWVNEPTNRTIPLKYLAVPKQERPNVYKNVLDLYFMPVEMNFMPEVTWNGQNSSIGVAANPSTYVDVPDTEAGVTNAEIGTFCCGGNRGNMNTTTNFHVNFPEGLTITGNIIGGCNNSNETKTDANGTVMSHTGGFLLGTHKVETGTVKRTPQIHLTMRNQFRPTMEDVNGEVTTDESKLHMYRDGNNVYGGCYFSGTVRGDILIDMRSNMINGLNSIALNRGGDSRAVCNVYGAGYGSGTWVYGDTQVLLGKDLECSFGAENNGKYNTTGASANYVFGGGQRGNVVGTTTVRVLNGRVAGCVVGASYASNLFGSAQTIIGYPDTYYVCNTTGCYNLARVDQTHSDLVGEDGKPVVKRQIWHTKGDIVSEATYSELTNDDKQYFDAFTIANSKAEQPTDWSKVNIQIDQAIYGGGYALPDGSGSYTVRKYTNEYNLNNYAASVYGMPAGITLDDDGNGGAYGGNTFVMIGDHVAEDTRDHITISSSQLVEQHPGADDELFGKYYRSNDGIVYINYPTTIRQNDKFNNDTKFYNFIGRGGLYGDGRLSLSEGYRVSDIRGYGYNGTKPSDAKLLNCLHRFDASRFTDCCVSILGDLDYTTSASGGNGAVKYAIARIGELQMVSSIDDANNLNVDVTSGGTVTQMGKRSRNYIGFSNIVSNLGAVWSNVPFDGIGSKHHNETGAVTASKTYKGYKQGFITDYYDSQKAELRTDVANASAEFQKRNNGTAKNMLGVASGFALRVENAFAGKVDGVNPVPVDAANNFYYGPAYGVFEVKLVNTRPGEAAGYVFAQNMHQQDITDAESKKVHDFMESTGNFVFPMSDTRKVVDDCYPDPYTMNHRDNENAIESRDGHYWYVTGMNYYYYGTITGYTFDSKDTPIKFNMNSKELRINLTGAKTGQQLTLKEFRMLKNHSTAFASYCDIENKFYTNRNTETNKGYYDEGWTSPNADSYYKLSLSATEEGVYKESEETGDKIVPHIPALAEFNAQQVPEGKVLTGTLQSNNPYLAIRLTDKVNNSGKAEDGKTSYLKKYLDEACQAIIVLTSPAVDDNGAYIYDKYVESNHDLQAMQTNVGSGTTYYIMDGNGDYRSLTAAEVKALTTKPSAVFVVADGANKKTYEYTINLTIKYIQGPDYEGKATIQNCALPGEMIRLSSSTLTIISDAIDMPQNGSMWTVGPGKKLYADNGTYTWTIDESQSSKILKYNPKDDPTSSQVIASRGVLTKAYYDEDSKDLFIPAYYYMDGYVARFSYSVKGIYDDEAKTKPTMFHVTVSPEDTLLVHNYHRMNPTLGSERTPVETYIRKAAERYASDVTRFADDKAHDADDNKSAEPRQTNAALNYVNCPRVYIEDVDDLKKFAEYVNAASNEYGENIEFFLMEDLTVPDNWTPITNFKGTFHGNGHLLKGLGSKSLFAANAGNIHNLGLETGLITHNDNKANNAKYHCCYTKGNNTVYRMDGTAKTDYTSDDWKYGKVAYDLNQYYLEERYDRGDDTDVHNHNGYVEQIFANGDYQYARTYAKDVRDEYLRINAIPHYIISDFDGVVTNPENITYHNTKHDVDAARAYYVNEGNPAVRVFKEYRPLFDETNVSGNGSTASAQKNDYIFFGQTLTPTGESFPHVISTTNGSVEAMTNRVWRAYGFYHSSEDDAFHFNRNAHVMNPRITAIDFNGWHDKSNGGTREWNHGYDGKLFYPQVIDRPASITAFTVADNVTRNLLVYNQAQPYSHITNYNEATAESAIKYHAIGSVDANQKTIEYFHLVERDKDSQPNNDFNAPIAFDVTNRAWYTRQPKRYRELTDVNYGNGSAWEGIALPFTANKVEASLNGEITHFYGTPTAEMIADPTTNDKTLHHEYWLNGLVSVDGDNAKFKRPGTESGLFNAATATKTANDATATNASMSYNFNNDWFSSTYRNKYLPQDESEVKSWYQQEHTLNDYQLLTADVPYIVSFPGYSFYEFDLSSQFYNEMLDRKVAAQTVTFSNNVSGSTPISIAVTDNNMYVTTADGYKHHSTYCAINNAEYAINADGTAFNKESGKVMPFRTYMTTAPSSQSAPRSIIRIGTTGEEETISEEFHHPDDPDNDLENSGMIIYVRGEQLIIESSYPATLNVYTVGGQLVRIIEVIQGTNTYNSFVPGIYIVNGKKLAISK